MKRWCAAAALLLMGGCTVPLPEGVSFARPFGTQPIAGTIVYTIPSGATLTYPDGECITPCRIDYGERIEVTLGKAGYRKMTLEIPVGAKDTTFELAPVGRSTAVEEVALPEL